jgi:hypothetical protein
MTRFSKTNNATWLDGYKPGVMQLVWSVKPPKKQPGAPTECILYFDYDSSLAIEALFIEGFALYRVGPYVYLQRDSQLIRIDLVVALGFDVATISPKGAYRVKHENGLWYDFRKDNLVVQDRRIKFR